MWRALSISEHSSISASSNPEMDRLASTTGRDFSVDTLIHNELDFWKGIGVSNEELSLSESLSASENSSSIVSFSVTFGVKEGNKKQIKRR